MIRVTFLGLDAWFLDVRPSQEPELKLLGNFSASFQNACAVALFS
jgi:hypothetical protein